MDKLTFHVEKGGERLDRFLSECESLTARSLSRNRLQQLIREGRVEVNGTVTPKPNFRLSPQDTIDITLPAPVPLEVQPEPLDIEVLYQDADLAVVCKPAGMITHPAGSVRTGTLVNALLHHLDNLSGIGGKLRPGIVHRLDKGTSGLLLAAKNDQAHQVLSRAFKERTIQKSYLALARGQLKQQEGIIDFPLTRHRTQRHKMAAVPGPNPEQSTGGRKTRIAVTKYQRLRWWDSCFLAALQLETGRTHQLRVHLAQLGHPILGDETYGYRWKKSDRLPRRLIEQLNGPALHAWKLEFMHPTTGKPMKFESPAPPRIQRIVDYLEGNP